MSVIHAHPHLRPKQQVSAPHIYRLPQPERSNSSPLTQLNTSPTQPSYSGRTTCNRCSLSFSSRGLYQIHAELSLDHNLCPLCGYNIDFYSFNDLQDHIEKDHLWCETCNWFAASAQGLETHLRNQHLMCAVCREFFRSMNELAGHANTHRPQNVPCFLCEDATFALMSAVFNHIESEKCRRGALREDVRIVMREFWRRRHAFAQSYVPDELLFTCQTCQKNYSRLSDLLQHAETTSCPDGYCKGTGTTKRMVEFVQAKLGAAIEARGEQEYEKQEQQEQPPATPTATRPMFDQIGVFVHPRVLSLRDERYF